MLSAIVELVSKSVDGNAAGSYSTVDDNFGATVSANGRYVAFRSLAPDLVSDVTVPYATNVYRYDRETGDVILVSISADGTSAANNGCEEPSISADGNVITFASVATNLHPNDGGNGKNVFARDVAAGVTHLVSVTTFGAVLVR
jgi:Tol biopolymer transport system component